MDFHDSTAKVIYDEPGVFRCQVIERRLFNLNLFDTEHAVFPHQVFNRRFDSYRFMIFNDWFRNVDDYNSLISFLHLIKETNFYVSCPPPFLVNPVKFTSKVMPDEFQQGIRYGHNKDHYTKDILTSPTAFYYGESDRWAMVLDVTNNLVIVGLEATTIDAFETAFKGKFFDVQEVIDWWIKGFEQLYELLPESFSKVEDKELDTPTQIKCNYGSESL